MDDWRRLGRNDDDRVSRAEFGTSAGTETSAFIQLDTDGNGTLDADEFSVWQNDTADTVTGTATTTGRARATDRAPASRAPANDAGVGAGTTGTLGVPGTAGSIGVPGTTGSASTRATGNVGGDIGASAGGSVSGDVGVSGR